MIKETTITSRRCKHGSNPEQRLWRLHGHVCAADVPLFSFGVIADVQYCDCPLSTNYSGTEKRDYRGSLVQLATAVEHWNVNAQVSFVLQLGDLIDGQNNGTYGHGLDFSEPKSKEAFAAVITHIDRCNVPFYHTLGNHELCKHRSFSQILLS
jgi:manganese-dependent ADP-ribose/CDP-alcohol diphosphatase